MKCGSSTSTPKASVKVRSGGYIPFQRPKKYASRNWLARSCYACFLTLIIYQYIVPPRIKTNAAYYVQVLKLLQKHINKKIPEIAHSWILHARLHVPVLSVIFWKSARYRWFLIHPTVQISFLTISPSLRKALWGLQFSSNHKVVTASQIFFNSLSQGDFEKTIMTNWIERMNMCTKSRGQYFEKGPVTGSDSENN